MVLPPANISDLSAAVVDTKRRATAATAQKGQDRKQKALAQDSSNLGERAAQIAQQLIEELYDISALSDDGLFKLQFYTEGLSSPDSEVVDLASGKPRDLGDDPLVKLVRRAFNKTDSVECIISAIMDDSTGDGPTFLAWRQMAPKDIIDRKSKTCPYQLTSPDGLCGYRAAFQIYLFSKEREPRDVNLMDPKEAAEFLQWLRGAAERPAGTLVNEAIGHAIRWIEDNYIKSQKGGFFKGIEAHTMDSFGWCNSAYLQHLLPGVNWQLVTQGPNGLCPLIQSWKRSGRRQIFAQLLDTATAFHFIYYGDAHFWFPKPQRAKSESGRTTDDTDRVMSALRNVTEALVREIRSRLGKEDKKAASFAQLRMEIEKSELNEQEIPEVKQRLQTAAVKELGEHTQWVLGLGKDSPQEETRVSCSLFKTKRNILCLVCGESVGVRSAGTHSRSHAQVQLEALKRPHERKKAAKAILAALGGQKETGREAAAGEGGGGSRSRKASAEETTLASTTHLSPPSTDLEPSLSGSGVE